MRTILIISVLSVFTAAAQTALREPQFGLVRDSAGVMRVLGGSAGSFLAGESLATGVQSAAWCGSSGFLRTEAGIQWLSPEGLQTVDNGVAAGRLLCADGAPALQSESRLERWTGQRFEAWPLDVPGEVLAVDNGTLLVRESDGLALVVLDTRRRAIRLSRAVPVQTGRATLLEGSLLYQDANELVLWQPDGGEMRASLPRDCTVEFEPLGPGWIHVVDFQHGVNLGVRIKAGELQVFELPEVQP